MQMCAVQTYTDWKSQCVFLCNAIFNSNENQIKNCPKNPIPRLMGFQQNTNYFMVFSNWIFSEIFF